MKKIIKKMKKPKIEKKMIIYLQPIPEYRGELRKTEVFTQVSDGDLLDFDLEVQFFLVNYFSFQ